MEEQGNNKYYLFQIGFITFYIILLALVIKFNINVFFKEKTPSFTFTNNEPSTNIKTYHKSKPIQLKMKNVMPNLQILPFANKYFHSRISGQWTFNTTIIYSSYIEPHVVEFYQFNITSFYQSHNLSLYKFKNVFYLIFGGIYIDKTLYSPHPSCLYDTNFQFYPYSTSFPAYQYNSIIGNFREKMNTDRNFIYLFLPSLIGIPNYILYSSYFPFYGTSQTILSFFDILGLKRDQIILEKRGVFARDLFTVLPSSCDYSEPLLIFRFRQKISKLFGLDYKLPYRYVIFDEPYPHSRILNKDEIVNEARKLFPNLKWEYLCGSKSIENNIILFNQMKLFLGVRSVLSLFVNFMQKNTIIIDIQTNPSLDIYFMASSLPRYYIVTRDINFPPETHSGQVNLNIIKDCLTLAKKYL